MAGMCCGVVGEIETSATVLESGAKPRRTTTGLQQLKFAADNVPRARKRRRLEKMTGVLMCGERMNQLNEGREMISADLYSSSSYSSTREEVVEGVKYGVTSVCGRRREMEDAVAAHPSFYRLNNQIPCNLNFYGVYDGHGCSHVAMKCRDRMHEIVKELLDCNEEGTCWKETMIHSFYRMDKEVTQRRENSISCCKCELQTPQCEAVGSTAVVALVTPDKIVVSNCGDSRAVLCRNGVAVPLSSDHKPDREDELARIEDAGGRVIDWDCPRVLGFLAMSRAIDMVSKKDVFSRASRLGKTPKGKRGDAESVPEEAPPKRGKAHMVSSPSSQEPTAELEASPVFEVPRPRGASSGHRAGKPFLPDWGLTEDDSALASAEFAKKIMQECVPPVDKIYLKTLDSSYLTSNYFRLQQAANEFGTEVADRIEEKTKECEYWAGKYGDLKKSFDKLSSSSEAREHEYEIEARKNKAQIDHLMDEVAKAGQLAVQTFKSGSEFDDAVSQQAADYLLVGFRNFKKQAAKAYPDIDFSAFVLNPDETDSESEAAVEEVAAGSPEADTAKASDEGN